MKRGDMGRRALACAMLGVWAGSAGCNVVAHAQARIDRRLRRAGARSRILETGPDRIHVWTAGTGPAVVLLHGFGGTTALQWEHALRGWSSEFQVVAPDLLWFGESASNDRDPSIEHQARAVAHTLDALGIASYALLGLSYGGIVADALLRLRPSQVRCRVTIDSPADLWSEADHRALLQRLGVDDVAEVFVPSTPEDVQRLLELARERPPRLPKAIARDVIETMYDPRRAELTALLHELQSNHAALAARGPAPEVPSLVVWGEGDMVFPVDIGRRLAARQHASLEVIPGTRHLPMADAPDAFDAIVLPFLRRHALGSQPRG